MKGGGGQHIVPDGTPRVLVDLAQHPTARVGCIFDCRPEAYPSITVWYMPVGCIALHANPPFWTSAPWHVADYRVQPLCLHHTERQEPLQQAPGTPGATEWPRTVTSAALLQGSHLLVDLTLGADAAFPERSWAESGPHWSDTANGGKPLPPALELGYTAADLRQFALGTPLGRLVFMGYSNLVPLPEAPLV